MAASYTQKLEKSLLKAQKLLIRELEKASEYETNS
jgi:hypothetical protein